MTLWPRVAVSSRLRRPMSPRVGMRNSMRRPPCPSWAMCASLRANWLTREGVTVKARLDVGIQMRHEVAENLVVDFVGGVCLLECLVGAEAANRGIESRDVEQRWQEQQEDEIRRQL